MTGLPKKAVLMCSLMIGLAGCGGERVGPEAPKHASPASYRHEDDPLVNPPFIFEPFPDENPEAADQNATLIRYVIDEPTSLNPIFPNSWADGYLTGLQFGSLVRFNEDLVLVWNPERVEAHEDSEDRLETTLHLRPGLIWHDGRPWTAEDIRFSWEVINDDRVPAASFKITAGRIADIEVIDDLTLRVTYETASPTNVMNTGFQVIPKHIYGVPEEIANDPSLKFSEYYTHFSHKEVIGSGPYRFVEWIPNDRVVVERWDDSPLRKPHFKRQILKIQPDRNVALLLFKKGQLDDIWLTVQQFATQTNDAEFARVGVKAYGVRRMFGYIGWNMDGSNPFFTDRRVRRAMAHAFDRDRVLRDVSYNLYLPSNGIFDPEHWAYNPNIELIPFDLNEAARLLDEAGWQVSEDDGWRYKEVDGVPVKFEFQLKIYSTFSDAVRMADIFRNDLNKIGIGFKNRSLENATLTANLLEHEYQAVVGTNGFSIDPDYWRNFFHSDQYDKGRNYGAYTSERVDELFALQHSEFDEAKRAAYFREIQSIIYEDQPFLFMWNYSLTHALNRRVRGISISPAGVYSPYPGTLAWWIPEGM